MKKLFSTVSLLLAILIFIAGCGPSSVVVRTQPAPPVYARPAAPGANYVWVEGEWIRRGHGYVYREGYWTAPRAQAPSVCNRALATKKRGMVLGSRALELITNVNSYKTLIKML